MQENRKQRDMYVNIYDNFTEQGITLEQAYILGRVARFNNVGSPYYESNKTISKIMGKSESTVKRYIDGLVKKGYLHRKTSNRKRLLSINASNYKVQNEPCKSNKNSDETLMRVKMNPNKVQNEPCERVKMNHYKIDNKIEDKIEENQELDITELTGEALNNKLPDNENIVLTEEQKRIKEEIERIGRGY